MFPPRLLILTLVAMVGFASHGRAPAQELERLEKQIAEVKQQITEAETNIVKLRQQSATTRQMLKQAKDAGQRSQLTADMNEYAQRAAIAEVLFRRLQGKHAGLKLTRDRLTWAMRLKANALSQKNIASNDLEELRRQKSQLSVLIAAAKYAIAKESAPNRRKVLISQHDQLQSEFGEINRRISHLTRHSKIGQTLKVSTDAAELESIDRAIVALKNVQGSELAIAHLELKRRELESRIAGRQNGEKRVDVQSSLAAITQQLNAITRQLQVMDRRLKKLETKRNR